MADYRNINLGYEDIKMIIETKEQLIETFKKIPSDKLNNVIIWKVRESVLRKLLKENENKNY